MNKIDLVLKLEDRLKAEGYFSSEKILQFWPIVRLRILAIHDSDSAALRRNGMFRTILPIIGILYKIGVNFIKERALDRENSVKLEKCDVFFKTFSNTRVADVHNVYIDRFVTPIYHWIHRDNNDLKIGVEEMQINGEFRYPRDIPSTYIGARLLYLMLLSKIFKIDIDDDIIRFIRLVNAYIAEYDEDEDLLDERQIASQYSYMMRISRYYVRLFKRIDPKIVFVVCYYGPTQMAMICAAKSLGITVVDIQHGVQGKNNGRYGQWPVPPAKGYNLLPDLFWCWSDDDGKSIEKWGNNEHRTVVGGNVYLQYVMERGDLFPISVDLTDRIKRSGRTKVILVTLQSFEKSDGRKLFNMVIDAASSNEADDLFWLIRMHPSMYSSEDCLLMETQHIYDRIDISMASRAPLHKLLGISDLHLTGHSAVILEASELGVMSLSIFDKLDLFEDQQMDGSLILLDNDEPLVRAISKAIESHTFDAGRRKSQLRGDLAVAGLLKSVNLQ